MRLPFALILLIVTLFCNAQNKGYWQQKADYKMEVSVDEKISFQRLIMKI